MKYGAVIFQTDYAIRPDEIAREAEDRGFESIFFVEHTHIPASRRTPYPLGGELPREYSHTMDPIVLAKQVASLDMASRGRLIFGIGGGWNVEEMENHGTAFKSRWKLLRERVEAMKAIWTQEEASY